jgi:hypothetical protein
LTVVVRLQRLGRLGESPRQRRDLGVGDVARDFDVIQLDGIAGRGQFQAAPREFPDLGAALEVDNRSARQRRHDDRGVIGVGVAELRRRRQSDLILYEAFLRIHI